MNRPDVESIVKNLEWEHPSDDDVTSLAEYIQHLEALNKRLEQETALKCAYLAWQMERLQGSPHRMICRKYGLNLDSLYSTTWKELNK